jgi:hypothetical protein
VNDESGSGFGCDPGPHGGNACTPGCYCACHPPTAEDPAIREGARAVREVRLAPDQWTDVGAGLQVRLA